MFVFYSACWILFFSWFLMESWNETCAFGGHIHSEAPKLKGDPSSTKATKMSLLSSISSSSVHPISNGKDFYEPLWRYIINMDKLSGGGLNIS